jgi:hypothetical protein
MQQFSAQLLVILSIIGGVITILAYLNRGHDKEKNNAVDIANLKKDIEAQKTENNNLKQEMRLEIGHVQRDIHEIKVSQGKMAEAQSEMKGDVKSILLNIKNN